MDRSIHLNHPTLGVCYYPEHWPKNLWADDLARMKAHGIEVIRIAEFAWNKFEPAEGEFSYDFFDAFMQLTIEHDMKVIFCTPSATPPAWLSVKYPSILNTDINGVKYRHGQRRHYNYNSRVYRRMVGTIVTKIAEHYGQHPQIIGWQIDNELNCGTAWFRSQSDHEAFRVYLKQRFGTLAALNDAIGAEFWNQTYTDWEEIYLASPTVSNSPNPHLLLEEVRFISESAISFCQMQSEIIRKFAREGQFITTNGIFPHLDSHKMTEKSLDFMSFDNYPNFFYAMQPEGINNKSGASSLMDRTVGLGLSRARSISPNFCIMEQQSGPQGWNTRMEGPAPKPGQMRLWALQGLAHGADMVSFFRWRTASYGTEIYWHGLLNYDNRDNRRMQELLQLKQDFEALKDIAGSRYRASIAMLRDYDNEWDGESDNWHGPMRAASEMAWFSATQKTHSPMDLLYIREETRLDELKQYRLMVYPHATILTERTAQLLHDYVADGGLLIVGARSGYKDIHGRCPMQPMPGPIAGLVGAQVNDFTMLGPQDAPESILWGEDQLECLSWCDILEPIEGGQVLARYHGNYFSGQPALMMKQTGQGAAYYFGGGFSEQSALMMLHKLQMLHPQDWIELPPSLELAIREKQGTRYAFLLNYSASAQPYSLKQPMLDLLSGQTLNGKGSLAPYGVLVLKMAS